MVGAQKKSEVTKDERLSSNQCLSVIVNLNKTSMKKLQRYEVVSLSLNESENLHLSQFPY